MKKTRISIIEDNKVVRDNVSKFIGFHEEFELSMVYGSVESFLHALTINPTLQSDILLLDIGLPGLSGLEAIPLILEKMPQQDIIMLTTYEEEDVILRALCSGACSYISKKASLEEIVDALRIVANGGSYMSPSVAREIVNHLMGGRVSKAKVLAYLYQHGETEVMDIMRATAAEHGRTPIANVHDAIFFKQRLGAELKAEIEWQMRAQTGNAYWHLTPKELRRYEPRHLDAITEEAAHKQRMAAEQARAVSYRPVGIAEFEVSVG
jgi:CheY-like chemotaxis protein